MDSGAAARIALFVTGNGPVIEIGPGTGSLTLALLQAGADVTALDVDPDMIRILRFQDELRAAHVVEADALQFDYEAFAGGRSWRMTGNLPYNIATPLVMRLVEMRNGPEIIAVMVQKEVAERFAAQPGTKAYGSLSVATQYAMHVHREFTLGPRAFFPAPKVESTVIRLVRREEPAVRVADEHWFLQVVRAAFAYRRKTLTNSLSLALSLERKQTASALQEAGFDTEIRGEQLDLAGFAAISNRLRA